MDFLDFFKISDKIILYATNEKNKEIYYRTAINRLYYSIYHHVIHSCGIFIPNSQKTRYHAYVKEQIENTMICSDYSDLEELRVNSDYFLSVHIDKSTFI
ncbi:MAG: hypothetical protein K9W44_14865 [Candidatus Lokiarchaeota archaeon]|nr:hypothetical protein [Candidatus Harpocratesius repetitus]